MAAHTESSMDYEAHKKTYEAFIHLAVLTTVFCIAVVVMLAVGGVGGSWGLAGLGVILATIAVGVGALMGGSPLPVVAVTLFILVLKLLFG